VNRLEAKRLAFLYAPEIEGLSYPPDCPFKTQRVGLTRQRLLSFGLLGDADHFEIPARKASPGELLAIHSQSYLDELQRAVAGDLTVEGLHMGLGQQDTPVFADLFEYGSWACGAGLTAADLLLDGQADIAFNLLGGFHHAFPAKAGGFCYLNDVALACHHLAAAGRRVACLDVDAHHGDGTQALFYDRKDVLTISTHESGNTLFPWGGFEDEIGEGEGLGYNANLSLPSGTYDEAFVPAIDRVVMPLLRFNNPDVIVLELGLDILAGDPLTHLHMTNNVVVDVLDRLLQLNKPLLVIGGGGYHVDNTVRGWALAWRTCTGDDAMDDFSFGLGGVMLGSSEWAGGLRDRVLSVIEEQRREVESSLERSIHQLLSNLSPHHELHSRGDGNCKAGTQD
jgi:acetoin utilization protein AcuC